MAQIQIEKDYLTSSFSILEDQPMDMLLGLDMLKKQPLEKLWVQYKQQVDMLAKASEFLVTRRLLAT